MSVAAEDASERTALVRRRRMRRPTHTNRYICHYTTRRDIHGRPCIDLHSF